VEKKPRHYRDVLESNNAKDARAESKIQQSNTNSTGKVPKNWAMDGYLEKMLCRVVKSQEYSGLLYSGHTYLLYD